MTMERLTHKRVNGIKEGYWSPNKKQELVDTLAAYENTGLTPEQIREINRLYAEKCRELAEVKNVNRWIPVDEGMPENDDYILLSFENFPIPDIGRYEQDEEGGAFYPGDEDYTYASFGLFVNAWRLLPEPYRLENEEVKYDEKIDYITHAAIA